jgi:hypothetical protein
MNTRTPELAWSVVGVTTWSLFCLDMFMRMFAFGLVPYLVRASNRVDLICNVAGLVFCA